MTLAVTRGRTDHREVLPQREPAHRAPSTRNSVRSLIANDELRSALDTSIPPLRRNRTLRPEI